MSWSARGGSIPSGGRRPAGYSTKTSATVDLRRKYWIRTSRLAVTAIDDAGGTLHARLENPDTPFSGATATSRPFPVGLFERHFSCLLFIFGDQRSVLDSSLGNHRQEESNNRVRAVRRRAGARSVEWRCRRGGMRLRVCWPAGDGHWGGGESGCWRGGRRGVCERTERGAPLARLLV